MVGAVADELLKMPLQWQVADSRRTPQGTLAQFADSSAILREWQGCPPDWLAQQMASAGQIWVTGDSISMIFEALQSRARVGIIALPSRKPANKVRSAVQRLVDQGLVTDRLTDAQAAWAPRAPLNQHLISARALLRRCGIEIAPVPEKASDTHELFS